MQTAKKWTLVFRPVLVVVVFTTWFSTVSASPTGPRELQPFLIAGVPGADCSNPAISGDIVLFEDTRHRPGTTVTDVYGVRMSTGEQFLVSANPGSGVYDSSPAIEGNIAIWQANPNAMGSIFGKNLVTGETFDVCVQTSSSELPNHTPAISGDLVVWRKGSMLHGDIWGKYLSGGDPFPIMDDSLASEWPEVSGDLVVWEDTTWSGSTGTSSVRAKRLSDGRIFSVSLQGSYPDVSGNIIVWQQGSDIWGMDVRTEQEFAINADPGRQTHPRIDGDYVVWYDEAIAGISGKNLRTGDAFCIPGTSTPGDIVGCTIVWDKGNSHGDWEIYGAVIPEPPTLSLMILAGVTLLLLRRPLVSGDSP
ncbi:MAG: hypothetical protein NTW96_20855 [Planctomycetia bacterium]|nr:hypothetical protein [Planctomycetia bacterium]